MQQCVKSNCKLYFAKYTFYLEKEDIISIFATYFTIVNFTQRELFTQNICESII